MLPLYRCRLSVCVAAALVQSTTIEKYSSNMHGGRRGIDRQAADVLGIHMQGSLGTGPSLLLVVVPGRVRAAG